MVDDELVYSDHYIKRILLLIHMYGHLRGVLSDINYIHFVFR